MDTKQEQEGGAENPTTSEVSTGAGATSSPRSTYTVTKPNMGSLLQTDKDTFVAIVGGKPKRDWSGLETPMNPEEAVEYQHRPKSTAEGGKGKERREKGQQPAFTVGKSDLTTFIQNVSYHLESHGMDTIAYIPDPMEQDRMTNCVSEYARLSKITTERLIVGRESLYDSFDRKNDKEAVQYLLNSVDASVQRKLKALGNDRPFALYFAEFIEIARKATVDQIKTLKEDLQALQADKYTGENIEDLWLDVKPKVDELFGCDAYDHNITQDLAEMLSVAGGTGPGASQFQHEMRDFRGKIKKGLAAITLKSPKEADRHMAEQGLLPSDLFAIALTEYRRLVKTGKWPPANNSKILSGDPPRANIVSSSQGATTAIANALVQMMSRGSDGTPPKEAKCHLCGQPGHYKKACPKSKGNGKSPGTPTKKNGTGKGKSKKSDEKAWKTKGPSTNEPQEKIVGSRTFYWCATCNRWTTTHTTATHVKKSDAGATPTANLVPTLGNFAWFCPFVGIQNSSPGSEVESAVSPDPNPTKSTQPIGNFAWFSPVVGSQNSCHGSVTKYSRHILKLIAYLVLGIGPFINTIWTLSTLGKVLSMVGDHWKLLLPALLWNILLAATIAVPWLVPPEPDPPVTRRQRRLLAQLRRKARRTRRDRHPSSIRLGYHRSYPLKYRNSNHYVQQPPAKDRHTLRNFSKLVGHVHKFARHFPKEPASQKRSGMGPGTTQRGSQRVSPPLVPSVWMQDSCGRWYLTKSQTKKWVLNNSGQWARGCRPEPSQHPLHQARSLPTKRRFLSKKARTNFSALIANHQREMESRRSEPRPVPTTNRPPLFQTRRTRQDNSRVTCPGEQRPAADWNWTHQERRSFEEIFGTPQYFAFAAQDFLDDDLRTLAKKCRESFLAAVEFPGPPKTTKRPVVWDSGASVSVSFDKSDFVGPLQSVTATTRLQGFFRNGPRIRGVGHVAWSFQDVNGMLRTLKLPAIYVPEVKQRLLSTSSLLKQYPNETLTIVQDGMKLSGDRIYAAVEAPTDELTNLPTAYAYTHGTSIPSAVGASTATQMQSATAQAMPFPVASLSNANLTDAQRELLRWHQKLGHVGYRRVQFLLRTGILAHTETLRRLHAASAKLQSDACPLCAACQFGKQRRRPLPGKTTKAITDTVGALKREILFPGQRVSIDHFICSTKGRLTHTKGKESENEKYSGGCLFVDQASGFIHVEMQIHVTTAETIQAKLRYERICRNQGVVPQEYHTDKGPAFVSAEFQKHVASLDQGIRFAGTGAHHHNGIAERAIQTVMSGARSMMLHAAIHWPEAADTQLWPLAVQHAVRLHNWLPSPETGLSPADLFTRTKQSSKHFSGLHPLFCPAYALDKRIVDGHKIPRWTPRSDRYIFVGFSDKHASSVPLLLNPRTGSIVSNYHVVFDDWFTTVPASIDQLPNFGSNEWYRLFGDTDYQFAAEQCDPETLESEHGDDQIASQSTSRADSVTIAMEQVDRTNTTLSPAPFPSSDKEFPRENTTAADAQSYQRENTTAANAQSFQRENTTAADALSFRGETTTAAEEPLSLQRENTTKQTEQLPKAPPRLPELDIPEAREPRRSSRPTKTPSRLSYDVLGDNAAGLQAHFTAYLARSELDGQHDLQLASAYKTANPDPDSLSYDQAMRDTDRDRWIEAAITEIRTLERKNCWEEVPKSQATSRIIPGTWLFRRKRTPDGEIKKWKGRFCVRGDMQEGEFDTFAPVVAWATIRLFLTLSLILEWPTVSVDFGSAFVQAPLKEPVWIHLPRGFRSDTRKDTCLRLKRSLYGLSIAPRLWYEHLFQALLHPQFGLTRSSIDPCLLVSPSLMAVVFVDDLGISARSNDLIHSFVTKLRQSGFELEIEGSFEQYLGIKFERDPRTKAIELTQKGLVQKIITEVGLQNCKPNRTPASQLALGKDDEGEAMTETWSYPSVIGMLLYLSTNTRPDISFAVSQVGRFSSNPKQSHATAVKTIVRYLAGTADKGMIMKPRGDLRLELYCDADFAGLYKRESDRSLDSARSRTGYIIKLSGCPLVWKSHLQTEVSLSTLEAEYSALSQALRTLLPLKRILVGITNVVGLPTEVTTTIRADVFDDNQACISLATNHRLTSRTKYFHVKWHWFWYNYAVLKEFDIAYVKSALQDADYLTKQLPRDAFQANRIRNQGW